MEGLRENARNMLLVAMEKGRYAKKQHERTAEVAVFELDAWNACGASYCEAYVNKMNKRCRDFLPNGEEIPWFFKGVHRLEDVPQEVVIETMRDLVSVCQKGKRLIVECTIIREQLDMVDTVNELRRKLGDAFMSTTDHLKTWLRNPLQTNDISKILQLGEPAFQSHSVCTDLMIQISEQLEKMKQKDYLWLDEASIIVLRNSHNTKFQEAQNTKTEMAKLLSMRKQLRLVYPEQIALIESFARISVQDKPCIIPPLPPTTRSVSAPPPLPYISQKGLNGEPPKKRAATGKK